MGCKIIKLVIKFDFIEYKRFYFLIDKILILLIIK